MKIALTLVLMAIFVLGAPSCQSDKSYSDKELFELFVEYSLDILLTEQLRDYQIEEAESEMEAGEKNMKELGERFEEIFFVQANIVRFIDIHPRYDALYTLLWKGQGAPDVYFGSSGDSFRYVEDYMDQHYTAMRDLNEIFEELALEDESGINLDYRPRWMYEYGQ